MLTTLKPTSTLLRHFLPSDIHPPHPRPLHLDIHLLRLNLPKQVLKPRTPIDASTYALAFTARVFRPDLLATELSASRQHSKWPTLTSSLLEGKTGHVLVLRPRRPPRILLEPQQILSLLPRVVGGILCVAPAAGECEEADWVGGGVRCECIRGGCVGVRIGC